jgi:hypothetical protein
LTPPLPFGIESSLIGNQENKTKHIRIQTIELCEMEEELECKKTTEREYKSRRKIE